MTRESAAVWFFGCVLRTGHWYWTPELERVYAGKSDRPTPFEVDGKFTPKFTAQGAARLAHHDGWTVLAFHDYSVDNRPGSNGAFLAVGALDYDDMMLLASLHFPQVLGRVGPIRLVPAENEAVNAT